MLLISMSALFSLSYSQSLYKLNGTVVNEKNEHLPNAIVTLKPNNLSTSTDANGSFVFENLKEGDYVIDISFFGYKTTSDTLNIDKSQTISFQLEVISLSLQEVVVTDNYVETIKKQNSLNIEIVNDDFIKQNMGGSLMGTLERLPGVTTIDIGSGQSKPVIRGLAFNRVLVVENNIKHEAQQWGADHGLEIDQYAVSSVQVIKGPASLEYGSDAIGGVINMKNRNLPQENSYCATVDLSGKTNNDFLGTSISFFGRKKHFFADFRATIIDYADYKVPTDSVDIYSYRVALYKNNLRNTAGKEHDLHFSFGFIQNKFQSKFFISNIHSKSGFFANAHGLEPRNVNNELFDKSSRDILYPFQTVNHFKILNSSEYKSGSTKILLNIGYQKNIREEWSQYVSHGYMPAFFSETLKFNPDLERQFVKDVFSANFKFNNQLNDKTKLSLGLNGEYQNNQISGRGFIIPAYYQLNIGSYAIAKHNFTDKSLFQFGFRYDFGKIVTTEYFDWFLSPVVNQGDTSLQYLQRADKINRNFSNFTWSAGYNYNPGKMSYKINIGKSFRMPIAKELAANGVNYHHFSYEVGNSELSPEISYQLDAGLEFATDKIAIGTTPFVNYFSNYIYLNPTSEHDRLYGNGNQVFYYTQSKVFRFGAEFHSHFQLLKFLQLGLMGEYVYSEQLSGDKKGFTLPFSPPPSAIFNVKLKKQKFKIIENAYLSIDYRITAAQNNIVPPEEPTPGYQYINIGLGGNVKINNQKISVSMQVKNLFNKKYFNHTSYYRLINVPEAGRNFIVNISIPFSGTF